MVFAPVVSGLSGVGIRSVWLRAHDCNLDVNPKP